MMTTTRRITAADDILTAINDDLRNRPTFTMTHAQLDARIYDYCDDPAADADDFIAIRNLLTPIINCFRD